MLDIRAALQRSEALGKPLSLTFGANPKAVVKWRTRSCVADARIGPRERRSIVPGHHGDTPAAVFRQCTWCVCFALGQLSRGASRVLPSSSLCFAPSAEITARR